MNAIERAIEAINQFPANDDASRLIAAKCVGLVYGYNVRWRNAGYTCSLIEQMLQAPLINPETKKKSRTFRIAGKLDVVAHLNNRSYVIDHKTTSQDITDPNAPYWRQLVIEGQVSHYHLLAWQNGMKLDGAVWDVVRKPSIAPKKLTKAERAHIVASGEYFGFEVQEEDRTAVQTEERETLNLYSLRLSHDCAVERPEWYFQRRPVPRLDHELLEYAEELWGHGQDIIHARAKDRHVRNSGACMLYGTPCRFLGICSGYDDPHSDKWRKKSRVHAELPELDGDGREVLTNSRIRNFQTCRRKHYYDYELGIDRYDEEEKEALVFGSLFHRALNAWWSFYLGESNEYCTDDTANGVGSTADITSQANNAW